jgi:uncharacterized protein YraI
MLVRRERDKESVKNFDEETSSNMTLGKSRWRWGNYIMEVACEDGTWMELAQNRVQWWVLVLAVLNIRTPSTRALVSQLVSTPASVSTPVYIISQEQWRQHAGSAHGSRTYGTWIIKSTTKITNTFHNVVEKRNPYQSKNRRQRPEPTPASLLYPP